MQRSEIYKMIDGEREYQQAQSLPDERDEYEWLRSIDYYSKKAWLDGIGNFPEHIRKIAALAVAALEQYGCEPREGYAPQPDSAQAMPDDVREALIRANYVRPGDGALVMNWLAQQRPATAPDGEE